MGTVFNCSGCTGLIKFSLVHPDEMRKDFLAGGKGGDGGAVLKLFGSEDVWKNC